MVNDATFITRLRSEGTGATLAVKDLIDVAGVPTTAGSLADAEQAVPAERDAACLAGARGSGARIVGKANLHELAFGAAGVNEHFGTPRNPGLSLTAPASRGARPRVRRSRSRSGRRSSRSARTRAARSASRLPSAG